MSHGYRMGGVCIYTNTLNINLEDNFIHTIGIDQEEKTVTAKLSEEKE